jgi:hypothetical protein
MATRYVINIQAFNKYGTEGYLHEPLVVQTDFGFNDVSQLPVYNPNDLPLAIILIVCGVGTLLLIFNVILIVYFIRKRKRKDETGSMTGSNETDAHTVEMFTPLPPYPDELNYNYDGSPHLYDVTVSVSVWLVVLWRCLMFFLCCRRKIDHLFRNSQNSQNHPCIVHTKTTTPLNMQHQCKLSTMQMHPMVGTHYGFFFSHIIIRKHFILR